MSMSNTTKRVKEIRRDTRRSAHKDMPQAAASSVKNCQGIG
jgi:hypothetical protein